MARAEKIALIGARGYETQSETLKVDCFPWNKLSQIENIRDYDTVILDLFSVDQAKSDWSAFHSVINVWSMVDILKHGGRILLLGDPRFSVRRRNSAEKKDFDEPFLAWTGITFKWDNQPGDSVHFQNDWYHRAYEEYVKRMKGWKYSLTRCELHPILSAQIYDPAKLQRAGLRLSLEKDDFCQNRYGKALAFSLNFVLERLSTQYIEPQLRFGPIVFLPQVDLNEDETILLVLRDLCGVELSLPEPDWLIGFEAPGQKTIDDEIEQHKTRIGSLIQDLKLAQGKRERVRRCLKLLYERGKPLEEAVREIMRGLGAHVEDPQETGKEDGWVTIQLRDKTYESVLEVKSTKNPQFGEEALRQLLDWINRGVELRKKKYKGIFVGNSSVDKPPGERPWPFSDSWKKNAELHQIVAVNSIDLYLIYVLSSAGALKPEEFWEKVFSTDGVFDAGPYRRMLSTLK